MVNGRTNTIIATVKDNDIPSELAVSPRTGDVYVVNEGDYLGPGPGGVWLINGRTSKVTATIADPDWPNAIAVSPRTGDVYVTNAVLGSPTVWVIAG